MTRRWPLPILDATSQWANAAFLGGHPNESISGRAHREGWRARHVINAVFFWQKNHCRSAFLNDMAWAEAYIRLWGDL